MTYEEVKDLLKNLRGKKSRLKALKAYIDEERALMLGVSGIDYEGLRVDSNAQNGTEDRYVKCVDRLRDLEERYIALMEDMSEEEELINKLMQRLSPEEYEVILNRFLRGLSRAKTARIMNYTIEGIKTIQERAIKKCAKNRIHP